MSRIEDMRNTGAQFANDLLPVVSVTASGKVAYQTTRAFNEMGGDLSGKNIFKQIIPQTGESHRDTLQQVAVAMQYTRIHKPIPSSEIYPRVTYIDPLGQQRSYNIEPFPQTDAEGNFIGAHIVFHDVTQLTDQNAHSEAMRRRDEKYNILNVKAYEEDLASMYNARFTSREAFEQQPQNLDGVFIIRADAGGLNYVNQTSMGHQAGDQYKMNLANVVTGRTPRMIDWLREHNVDPSGYLVGGDEFAILVDMNPVLIEEYISLIKSEVGTIQMPPDSLLPASLDIGYASAAEIFTDFQTIESQVKRTHELPAVITRYWKLQDRLADRRADIDKSILRIKSFIQLLDTASQEDFDVVYTFGAKGALSITRKQLTGLAKRKDMEYAIKMWVQDIFRKRDLNAAARTIDKYQQLAAAFIGQKTHQALS